jgi:hypothetical protein
METCKTSLKSNEPLTAAYEDVMLNLWFVGIKQTGQLFLLQLSYKKLSLFISLWNDWLTDYARNTDCKFKENCDNANTYEQSITADCQAEDLLAVYFTYGNDPKYGVNYQRI